MKLVIQNSASVWGGNEKWVAVLARGLSGRGHQVVVSCRGGSAVERELRRRGIATSAVRPGGYLDLPRGVRFARWLRAHRPDALLLTSWRSTAWGALAARRSGVARVVVRLGIVRPLEHWRHAIPFRGWVDGLIVNSGEIRDVWLRSAPWFPADRVNVVLNAVQPHPGLDRERRAALRTDLGAAGATRLVAGVGIVTHRKGFDLLLEAVALLDDGDVRVAIVGTGPEEGALRDAAGRLGIADRVHWAGRREDVPDLLAACDAFVLSSRNEGMANVMLEAMAAGVPVIAAGVSGVGAALGATGDEPPAGWIVPPEDARALSRALAEVLADARAGGSETHRRTAEAARRVREWFGLERMLDEVEGILFPPDAADESPPGSRR